MSNSPKKENKSKFLLLMDEKKPTLNYCKSTVNIVKVPDENWLNHLFKNVKLFYYFGLLQYKNKHVGKKF